MIVADSSVWIDYFRDTDTRETDLLSDALNERIVLVGDLILVEVLQGYRREEDFVRVLAAFDELPQAPMVGREIALKAARNYRKLRSEGITPRKTIDVMIATFCIERGHALLHSDRDFDAMERLGLRVV